MLPYQAKKLLPFHPKVLLDYLVEKPGTYLLPGMVRYGSDPPVWVLVNQVAAGLVVEDEAQPLRYLAKFSAREPGKFRQTDYTSIC